MKRLKLLAVVGVSGCGKSSMIRRVLQSAGMDLRLSISATTRDIRPGEHDLIDYEFLKREQVLNAIDQGSFL